MNVKKLINKLIIILSFIFTLISFFSFIFPKYRISDFYFSFSHYNIILSIFCAILILFIFKNSTKILKTSLILSQILIFILLITRYPSTQQKFSCEAVSKKNVIKILYGNIYWKNKEYKKINEVIKKQKPDVIMFVEFTSGHKKNINELGEYKYWTFHKILEKPDSNVVFSKLHFQDLTEKNKLRTPVIINFSGINFVLIHTASPTNLKNFRNRNQQWGKLGNIIKNLSGKIVILGDFNTSPESYYYLNFLKQFKNFKDLSLSKFPFNITWQSKTRFLLTSDIDHIFSNFTGVCVEKIKIPCSDHDGFFIKIFLK